MEKAKILNRVTDCGISGTALGSDALNRAFEYDPLYRVASADGRESDTQDQNDYLYSDAPIPGSPNANNVRAYERQYSYDKLGNIQRLKQLGTNGFTRDFSYFSGKNTLEKIENATPSVIESFTYDNVGNQITAGTTRNYVWNAANQLITYFNQAGGSDPTIFAQYDYDSGGNRVSKLVRTGSAGSPVYERTIYIDGVFEYHILENGATYEKNYVHVMDDASRIAMVRIGDQFPDDISDSITYILADQIGSSSIRLNTSGGVIDKEEYYPFGDSSLRTFSKKRYRYVGKEKDLESGLYYYGARYYAAWTCRFISVDPLSADYPFYTPYNYAGNKPVNKIDIDGMQEEGAESVNLNSGQPNVENKENNNSEILHKVKKGDTLSEISEKYNVSQQAIIDANLTEGGVWETKDRSKNWVYSGETLVIPNKTVDSEFMQGDVISLNEGKITIDKFGFAPDKDLPLINIKFTFSPSSQEALNQERSNYRWIQTFSTNEDYNSNYDYTYPPYEGNFSKNIMDISDRHGNSSMIDYNEDGMTIHDVLGRLSKSDYSVYWQAETSLVKVDSEGNASVLYTLTWGFTINKNGSGWSTGLNSISNPSDFHLRMIQINQSNLNYREPK
jgi:RHS repeat-associated protein